MATAEDKAYSLIDYLRYQSPFSTTSWAGIIFKACVNINIIDKLKQCLDDTSISDDNDDPTPFQSYASNNNRCKTDLKSLILGSLGVIISERKDDLGFNAAADQNKCSALYRDALRRLLPQALEVHIDEENERLYPEYKEDGCVLLPRLNELAQDVNFVKAFQTILLSPAFGKTLAEVENNQLSEHSQNFRICVVYVNEYFRLKRTPTVSSTIQPGHKNEGVLRLLKAWLDVSISQSEGKSYVQVIKEITAAKLEGRKADQVLKNPRAFRDELAHFLAPTTIAFFPDQTDNTNEQSAFIPARILLGEIFPGLSVDWTHVFSLGDFPQSVNNITYSLQRDWYNGLKPLREATNEGHNSSIAREKIRGKQWMSLSDTSRPSMFEPRERGVELFADLEQLNYLTSGAFTEIKYESRTVFWQYEEMSNAQYKYEKAVVPDEFKTRQTSTLPKGARIHYVGGPQAAESIAGCFIPGTLVWTSSGERAIESLRENDRILTRASSGEWGVKSDETVATPVAGGSTRLYGFDDGPAFFTRGHVFHTTTGLRALDPVAAKMENPWLEVGTLRRGHTVMKTLDGQTYQLVTIRDIKSMVVQCEYVWGVHLREGLRSYHANGYLVHLNYPEITIKSLADSLRLLPKDELAGMLVKIKELEPIFKRFGGGTVGQLLTLELSDDSVLRKMRPKAQDEFAPPPLYFQNRSYETTSDEQESLPENYYLPQIDALDGVLYIAGKPCTRSRILSRGVAWSRQYTDMQWEHGMATFGDDRSLVNADGFVWLIEDENPKETSKKPIRFQLRSTALRSNYLEPESAMSFRITQNTALPLEVQNPEVKDSLVKKISSWMDDTDEKEATTKFGSQDAFEQNMKTAEKVEGLLPRVPEIINTRVDETFQVKYDAAEFDESNEPQDDRELFTITREIVGSPNEVTTTRYCIPEIDAVALARQRALNLPTPLKYYTSSMVFNQQNNPEVLIEMLNPEALALAADNNVTIEGEIQEIKSLTNLTYRNSKSSLYLPFMPYKLQFRVNTMRGIFRGKLTEWQPDPKKATGGEGIRHLISGKKKDAIPSTTTIAQGSVSPAAPSQPGSPAPITGSASAQQIKSQVNLIQNFGVNTEQLRQDAQDYLYRAMLYHMDDADREAITNFPKPQVTTDINRPEGLPAELGDALSKNLKEWLKNTYCIAYLCHTLGQQSAETQKNFKITFTDQDRKRLDYWWRGKGKNSLCRSPEYSQLNALCASVSFRRRQPRIMQYIYDAESADVPDGQGGIVKNVRGGEKWAYLYYYQVCREDFIKDMTDKMQYTDYTRMNPLEYHCTVLNSLWSDPKANKDGAKLAKDLASTVNRHIENRYLFQHRLIDDPEIMENGLRDFFGAFLDTLLDENKAKAAGMDSDMRKKLIGDLEKQAAWKQIYFGMAAKEHKDASMRGAADAIRNAANMTTYGIQKASPPALKISKWIAGIYAAIRGDNGAIPREAAPAPGPGAPPPGPGAPPPGPGAPPNARPMKWTAGFGFLFTLASTAFYVYYTWDSWGKIGDMNDLDRTKMVAGAFQAFGGLVYGAWKSIQLWKGLNGLRELEAGIAQALEDDVRPRAVAIDFSLEENAGNPGARQRASALSANSAVSNLDKAENLSDAMLSARKPSAWSRLKAGVSKVGSKIKAKLRFNITETAFRCFAVAISGIMLVVACISAAQNWDKLDYYEKWLTVLSLVVQFVSIALEVIILFCAISPLWAVGLALVGVVLMILVARHQEKKEPPEAPITTFFRTKGKPLLERFNDPPPLSFDWKLESEYLQTGKDTTITVTGKPSSLERQPNLSSVQLLFTAGENEPSAAFDSKQAFKLKDSNQALTTDQCDIYCPKEINRVNTNVNIIDTSLVGAGLRNWVAIIQLKDMGVLKAENNGKIPWINVPPGAESITFHIRGIIAPMGKPDSFFVEKGKLVIQEQYCEDDGAMREMLTTDLDFYKVIYWPNVK